MQCQDSRRAHEGGGGEPCVADRRRRYPGFAAVVAALGASFLAGGCYERVVGVRGPGAATYQGDIYEPNVSNDRMPVVDDIKDLAYPPPPRN